MSDTPPATRRRRRTPADTMPDPDEIAGAAPADPPPPPARPPGTATKSLERRLTDFFAAFALPFAMSGDTHCATVIAQGAPRLAEAWGTLARESPAVKRVLDRMLEGGAWGGVIVSTLMIAIPVADHHGLYPKGLPNPFSILAPPTHSHGEQPTEATQNGNGAPATA